MNDLSDQKNDQKEILSKLTQSFLRKIREVEASPGKKDNLKKGENNFTFFVVYSINFITFVS